MQVRESMCFSIVSTRSSVSMVRARPSGLHRLWVVGAGTVIAAMGGGFEPKIRNTFAGANKAPITKLMCCKGVKCPSLI